MKSCIAALALLLLTAIPCAGEEEKRVAGPLVVYSPDFMFSVKEPEGWTADIENAPKLSAGVVFYRAGETFERHTVLIAIRISRKVDENTAQDLAHDMEQYRALYPDVAFRPLDLSHPTYRSFAKLFAIKNSSYEYLCYVNAGKDWPYLFTAAMGKKKAAADQAELEAYRRIVRSLEWLPMEGAVGEQGEKRRERGPKE